MGWTKDCANESGVAPAGWETNAKKSSARGPGWPPSVLGYAFAIPRKQKRWCANNARVADHGVSDSKRGRCGRNLLH
jgi:hypothetical protein